MKNPALVVKLKLIVLALIASIIFVSAAFISNLVDESADEAVPTFVAAPGI